MLNKIKHELQHVKDVKGVIERSIIEAPEGNLRCAISKGYYQYYIGRQYIKAENKEIAAKLAQKEYCIKLNKELKQFERALELVKDFIEEQRLEKIYGELHPGRKILVAPLYRPVEVIIAVFLRIECKGKGFEEGERTSYYTIKGERVRSKSEKIIADELYRHGIPYKYEMGIELQSWNKPIEVYPDFVVLNRRTGKRWIVEHLGMMDKPGYFEAAMQK